MSRLFSRHRGLSGRYCKFWPGLPSSQSFDLAGDKFRFKSLPSWPSFEISQPSLPSYDLGLPSLSSSIYSLQSEQVVSFYHLAFAKFWAEMRVRINLSMHVHLEEDSSKLRDYVHPHLHCGSSTALDDCRPRGIRTPPFCQRFTFNGMYIHVL